MPKPLKSLHTHKLHHALQLTRHRRHVCSNVAARAKVGVDAVWCVALPAQRDMLHVVHRSPPWVVEPAVVGLPAILG